MMANSFWVGDFTFYKGSQANRLVRVNNDGSIDNTFDSGSGFDGTVNTISIQSDMKIIIGGNFTSYNGNTVNRIARVNTDGSFDNTFSPAITSTTAVFTSAIQSDGKIFIAGNLTSSHGNGRIFRLNTDGSLDASFNSGTGAPLGINSMVIQTDGKIVIVGGLNSYNGTYMNGIARINTDGNLDTTFLAGSGTNNSVSAVALQNDGKIIIGGRFSTYNSSPTNYVARLNTNGTLDPSFNVGTPADNYVNTCSIQSDGKIIIGGSFNTYNGISKKRIARLNSDGSVDTSFEPGAGPSAVTNSVLASSIQANGNIIVGGSFTSFNNISRGNVMRMNSDGTQDTSFNPETGANGKVWSSAIQSDGKILIGGSFTKFNGNVLNRIARLKTDGTYDPTFNPGTGSNGNIYTIVIQSDGKILIGGDFQTYNGFTVKNIVRLNSDGSLDNSFNIAFGAPFIVRAISIQTDGKLIVAGHFLIKRLNADGTNDTSFNPGTGADLPIFSTVLQTDGKILIGGYFTKYNGTARNFIARLNTDGSLDATFDAGMGPSNEIYTMVLQNDGKIIIGGYFTYVGFIARARIARLNSDGTLDTSFDPGLGADYNVYTCALRSDGKVLIGGEFSTYNNAVRKGLAQLNSDGSLDATYTTGTGANYSINTISLQSNEDVIIGGDFTLYDGRGKNRITRVLSSNLVSSLSSAKVSFIDFSLYPNPNHGDFKVKFDLDGSISYTINIYDALGTLISTEKFISNNKSWGEGNVSIRKNGSYYLQIISEKGTRSKSFLVE